MTKPHPNTHWIRAGKLLAGQYPGSLDPVRAEAKLNQFLEFGVRHFVDLTEAGKLEPYEHILVGLAAEQRIQVTYRRIPIRDVSVPTSAAVMRSILDAIELALAQDGITYLHCWGGRGRTGLAAACWLQEQGRTPDEALAEVAAAWQQSGRYSERRYRSPETDEQEQWVRSWPTRRAGLVSLRDRYRGALLGLAAGDALGTTLEFKRPGTFTPLADMIGGGPFRLKPGQWTDDTSMALCLAESLVECRGFDSRDQMERYVRWYRHGYFSSTGSCFDIGNATCTALNRFEATGEPFAGSTDPYTAGNGSVMRLAPVALYYRTAPEQRALELAADSSRTTHGARAAVDGCCYLAALLLGALQGKPKEELWTIRPEGLGPEVAPVAAGSFRHKQPPQIRGTGYVVDSLEAALWAFNRTASFAEGALAAVNLGDDADTTGAVYGQLAGAYYGVEAIPNEWHDKLAMRETIESLADRLWLGSAPRLDAGTMGANSVNMSKPSPIEPLRGIGRLEALYKHLRLKGSLARDYAELGSHDPLPANALDEEILHERFTGCLLGGAVGDALGCCVEGISPGGTRVEDYHPWRGWTSGPKGTITDDTQFTMWLSQSMIAQGGVDPDDLVQRFTTEKIRGIGHATKDFVGNVKEFGKRWYESGVVAGGNGVAMRSAPIGLFYREDARALRLASILQAVVTHNDAMAIASGILTAHAIALLLTMQPHDLDLLAARQAFCRRLAGVIGGMEANGAYKTRNTKEPATLEQRFRQDLPQWLADNPDPMKVNEHYYSGAYVLETLPHAFYCFLRSPENFRETLLQAVNSSHDSDTVAAIAGNLSGALNGVRAIPQPYLDELEFRQELEHLGHSLLR